MRILSITAGAAGMYCGSCARDNALALELLARGHEVTLLPLYTPTTTDEQNVSSRRVLFGGISVYLQQYVSLFRWTPRFVDRLLDAPGVIKAFADRSISTDPKMLGDLTVSMLQGRQGVLRKEFDKLLEWLDDEPAPDVVILPNALLIGLAEPLHAHLKRPVYCTLQGEDLFLDGLVEPYRRQAVALIRGHVRHVDRFLAVSDFYVPVMADLLGVAPDRISVVPIGINMTGYQPREARGDEEFRVGYFARVAPEKGLHLLAEAYCLFRQQTAGSPARLMSAGYLGGAYRSYLQQVRERLERAGLAGEFTYGGAVDRAGKLSFLQSIDVMSVPATYDEPKGFFLLEAMASAVPVVQPRRGAFTEIVERTGGGVLVDPDSASALANGLHELWRQRPLRERLGRQGFEGVRARYTIARSADRLLEAFSGAAQGASPQALADRATIGAAGA